MIIRLITLLSLGLLAACSDPEVTVSPYTVTVEAKLPVAKVGDTIITKAELDHTLAFYNSNPMANFDESKKEVLNQLIEDQVLYIKAIENGFDKSPEYLNNKRKLLSYEYKKYLHKKVGLDVKVSEQDAKRHYQDNIEQYKTKSMYRIAIIKNLDSKQSIKDLTKKVKALSPSEGFANYAKLSDHFASKNKSGLLPWIVQGSRLPGIPMAVLQATKTLDLGDITTVTHNDDTYMVRLVSKREAITKPFSEISYQLQADMLEQAKKTRLQFYLQQSKESISIDVIEKNLKRKTTPEASKSAPPGFPVR